MHHDAIEKHVNKRLEYSSATIFLIPTGHKIGQKSVQIIVLLRGDVIKRTTGPEACLFLKLWKSHSTRALCGELICDRGDFIMGLKF